VELLLSNHPQDCLYCSRNGLCQLQDLAAEFHIHQRRFPHTFQARKTDHSSNAIVMDPSRCILCERCIRICNEILKIGAITLVNKGIHTQVQPSASKGLYASSCISCGQCSLVCPTAALQEKDSTDAVREALYKTGLAVRAYYSPEVGVSLAELLGLRTGKDISLLLPSLLRKMGFQEVISTALGNDLYASLTAARLEEKLKAGENFPVFSGNCPAWLDWVEKNQTQLRAQLNPISSPTDLLNALCEDKADKSTYRVLITGCTAQKDHFIRKQKQSASNGIERVITTRELARLVRLLGIDAQMLEEQLPDDPLEQNSYSTHICSLSGGTAESVARDFYLRMSGEELINAQITKIRSNRLIKEIFLRVDKEEYGFMAVNGIHGIGQALERIKKRENLLFVEVMACPGGCVNGGGNPIHPDEQIIKTRGKSLIDADSRNGLKAGPRKALVHRLQQRAKKAGFEGTEGILQYIKTIGRQA
jgi:NADH-quinone oxidoreductase subunit G/NADP-reducing hydrogenase subunit HndD